MTWFISFNAMDIPVKLLWFKREEGTQGSWSGFSEKRDSTFLSFVVHAQAALTMQLAEAKL